VGPRAISKDVLQARVALGALGDTLVENEDEHQRLRDIAMLEFQLGHRQQSLEATRRLLQTATNWQAIAALEGLPREMKRADIAYAKARDFALAIARKTKAAGLTIDALRPTADEHKEEFLAAVLELQGVSDEALEVAIKLAGDDVAMQVALWASDGVESPATLKTADLVKAGSLAIGLLEHRWDEVASSTDGAAVKAMSTSLLTVDALHLPARVAQLYWEEIDAGRIKADADTAEAILAMKVGGVQIVRAKRAHNAHPTSESLVLGFVHQLYKSGLAGDAHVTLKEAMAGLTSAKAKGIAQQLQALIRLRAGDAYAYRLWAQSANARSSVYMTEQEMRYSASEEQTVWTAMVREARIRAFQRGFDRRRVWWRNRFLAGDPKVPAAIRKQVVQRMRRHDPIGAVVALHCAKSYSSALKCEELCDLVDELQEGDELSGDASESLRRIGAIRDVPPALLWGFSGLEKDDLVSLRAPLRALASTPLAASDAYVSVRLQALLAADAQVEAAAFFASSSEILSAGSRLLYGLAIADLQAGLATPEQVLNAVTHRYEVYNPKAEPDDDIGWIQSEYGGSGKALSYVRGRMYWNTGHAMKAVAEWKPLLRDDVPEPAYVAGFLALAAHRAGDTGMLNTAKTLLHRSTGGTRLKAHLALATASDETTTEELAQIRTVLFFDDLSLLSYLEAVSKRLPGADGLARMRTFFSSDAPNWDRNRSWLGESVKASWLHDGADVGSLVTIARAVKPEEAVAALKPVFWADTYIAGILARYYVSAIAEAGSAAEARALAVKAAAALGATEDFSSRRWQLSWFHLLAGDATNAMAVATATDRDDDPWDEDNKLVMAAKELAANPKIMTSELLWKLWKHLVRGEDEVLDVAQALSDGSTQANGGLNLGCRLLVDADLQDEALGPCMHAWSNGGNTGDLAAAVSYLMVNRGTQAKALGFDDEAFFAEVRKRLSSGSALAWRQNYAVWLSNNDRHREAAAATDEAWAEGTIWGGRPNAEELKQAQYRGLGLRRQAQSGYHGSQSGSDVLLAFIALLEGRVDIARYYLLALDVDRWRPVESELAQADALVVGLVGLATVDIAAGTLDADGVGLWLRGISNAGEPTDSATFATRYGSSLLYLMARMEDSSVSLKERIRLARKLNEANPGNILIVTDLVNLLVADKKYAEAKELQRAGLESIVGNEILASVIVPEVQSGADIATISKHARFAAALAKVTDAEAAALESIRYFDHDEASSVYMPGSAQSSEATGINVVTELGARLFVRSFPRAAMCEGLDCLAGIAEGLAKQGFKEVWRAPVSLPAGDGAEILLATETAHLLTTVIPVGGRLFALYASGPQDVLAKSFPEMRLMRDSFRPLDRWMPAPAAEALRTRTGYRQNHEANRRARRLVSEAGSKSGCPLTKLLGELEDDEVRAQVLLEAVLDSNTATQRRRLFGCAKPKRPAAARLGLIALLSGDETLYEYGKVVAKTFSKETAADASTALLVENVRALSASERQAGAQVAPFGILQVLAALPASERQSVAQRMLKTDSARNRSLTLMAAGLIDEAMPSDLLRLQIRNSPANAAALAVRAAFFKTPKTEAIAATRRRLDAMKAPLDASQRALLAASVVSLVSLVDKADTKRLARAETLAATPKEETKDAANRARSLVKFVAKQRQYFSRALEIRAGKNSKTESLNEEDTIAQALVDSIEMSTLVTPKDVGPSDAQLKAASLSTLLDGAHWNYVRVPQPGLFVATLQGLYARLQGASKLDSLVIRRIGTSIAGSMGLGLFAEGGGLDLSRPLECASPGKLEVGFVCTAYVKDAQQTRAILAERGMGSDTSLALAMQFAQGGIMAPLFAVGAPIFLHSLIRENDEDPSAKTKVVAEERLRSVTSVGGHTLERMLIAQAREDGNSTFDSEHYLFIGDRVFAFSSIQLANRLLGSAPATGASLGENAKYLEASKEWKDGAALQAFMQAGSGATFDSTVGLEIFADSEGLHVRVPAGTREEFTDSSDTAALIPGTPISHVSFGSGVSKKTTAKNSKKKATDAKDVFGEYDPKNLGVAPPYWLINNVKRGSFAWYKPSKGKLWSEWIAIVHYDANVAKALREKRVGLGKSGAVREVGELHYARRGSLLLVSSTNARVQEALARVLTKGAPPVFMAGAFDGKACAAAIRAISPNVRTDLKNTLNVFAIYAGVLQSADFTTSIRADDGVPVFEGHLRPRLAKEGVDLNAVDQWLASPRIRNSATLPRSLSEDELEKPLSLTIEVGDDPQAFAESFAGIPRLTAKVLGKSTVRLTIVPGAKPSQSIAVATLSTSQRKQLLGSDGLLNPAHPRVKSLAKKIVPKDSQPKEAAAAILAWVKKNVAYEITPQAVDAIDVLDKKRGDCTEYSVLAVSLLRAAGVPAELRQGMAVQNAEMVAHNWIAYHDGTGWREADPTFGKVSVGSGHIEASLLEFISLISVGGLKIVGVELGK
tara:strand:- start:85338 stop:92699 length:7362 start_codon:yes stop_codon:yes gene_type:complete